MDAIWNKNRRERIMFIYISDDKPELIDKIIDSLVAQDITFHDHPRKVMEQDTLQAIDRNDPYYKVGMTA